MVLDNVRRSNRDMVLAAMEELDYASNGAARALLYGTRSTGRAR